MPEPRPQSIRHPLVIIPLVAALCGAGCDRNPAAAQQAADTPGISVIYNTVSEGIDTGALEAMRWQDIGPSAEACSEKKLTEKTLEATASMALPPVIYLRGLLKFTAGDTAGAEAEWSKIDIAAIPPDYLYLPWRLGSSTPGAANRYEEPLLKAVAENRAGPLVRARVHSIRGEWREALDAYLLSDPGDWSPFEIKTFGSIRLQAPYSRDAAVVLAGALAGGRVPKNLRVELAHLVKAPPTPDMAALEERLRNDPEFAKAAVAGAEKGLALRQAFASNKFQEVVDQTRSTDPMKATDEAVLLTFLSAAKVKDMPAAELWSAELLRRNPGDATRKWIKAILDEAR